MSSHNKFEKWKEKLKYFLPLATPPDPNEPTTILTLPPTMRLQAEVLYSRLESEGIVCILNREVAYSADPIRLRVRRGDVEKAIAILREEDGL